MPSELPTDAIAAAEAAVVLAQRVRAYHRRRKSRTPKQRNADIEEALTRLKAAMKPLRSEIGRFPYGPQTDEAEANRERIREASDALQRERRKLWKMRKAHKEVAAV
jgi:uncharacterized membrane protein